MPHATISLLGTGTPKLATDNDVTEARVQNTGAYPIVVQATNGTTVPTSTAGGVTFGPGTGDTLALADWFPGVSGANRLWIYGPEGAPVSMSYA